MDTVVTRTSRDTKTKVTYGEAIDLEVDDIDGDWAVVCEAHGTLVNVATKTQAKRVSPLEFCDYCRRLTLGTDYGEYLNDVLDRDLESMRREAFPASAYIKK